MAIDDDEVARLRNLLIVLNFVVAHIPVVRAGRPNCCKYFS